jgi:hypothetical protein
MPADYDADEKIPAKVLPSAELPISAHHVLLAYTEADRAPERSAMGAIRLVLCCQIATARAQTEAQSKPNRTEADLY